MRTPLAARHDLVGDSPVMARMATPLLEQHQRQEPDDDLRNWSSIIGIVIAIVGNALIALALNVQRYAHVQLNQRRVETRQSTKAAAAAAAVQAERLARDTPGTYGTIPNGPQGANGEYGDAMTGEPSHLQSGPIDSGRSEEGEDEDHAAATYLRSPYWWLGQVLITLGEMGNFLAYGFAPASIVSPLGVVALVANCVIAPILFNERFRQRDFWGVVVAVAGVVTVVLSAKQRETKLGAHEIWEAITKFEFELYMAITSSMIAVLIWASTKYGRQTVLVDLGLVGLFGKNPSLILSPYALALFAYSLVSFRWVYCFGYKGHIVDAIINSLACLHKTSYICSYHNPPGHRRLAGQIREQSTATFRLDTSHSYTVCHVHSLRHHGECRPVPRLPASYQGRGAQVRKRMLADFLWCVPHHKWTSAAGRRRHIVGCR